MKHFRYLKPLPVKPANTRLFVPNQPSTSFQPGGCCSYAVLIGRRWLRESAFDVALREGRTSAGASVRRLR